MLQFSDPHPRATFPHGRIYLWHREKDFPPLPVRDFSPLFYPFQKSRFAQDPPALVVKFFIPSGVWVIFLLFHFFFGPETGTLYQYMQRASRFVHRSPFLASSLFLARTPCGRTVPASNCSTYPLRVVGLTSRRWQCPLGPPVRAPFFSVRFFLQDLSFFPL